jgi:hypothetical protein
MRYATAALVGLVAGLLLAIAFVVVEFVFATARLPSATTCIDYVCSGAVQFGSIWAVLIGFAVGFLVAFTWFLRRHRGLMPR